MRFRIALLTLCGLTVVSLAAALVLHRAAQNAARQTPATAHVRELEVKGQIRSLEPGGTTVVIAHEEIPDFMPAMTMPFTVKDAALLRGLAVGDQVRFALAVTRDDSWIARIEKLAGPPGTPVQQAANPAVTNAPRRAEVGRVVPNFTLTDQNSRPCHLGDFRGQAVLLTFIYTRCPLPNFCPLMSKNFAALRARLEKEFPGKCHLLSVSFDPEHDTPAVLRQYAALFSHDDKTWTFASGTPAQVDFVTGLFGLVHLPDGGAITHDLRTALLAPDGRLVHVWRSNVWRTDEVMGRVREIFGTTAFAANRRS